MKNKFWNELYKLPRVQKPKTNYYSRKQCEKVAKENSFVIEWDYYGRGKHKVSPDELGEGIAYNTNEVMERILTTPSGA